MLTIDGSKGEGGGQILRTSLALSLVTGTPFRIDNIRAKRSRPGLLRQHLTAVKAATEVGGAETAGASLGSSRLDFTPGQVKPGDYHFAVGTAGSCTLILQTVLPALFTADEVTTLKLGGGTHNPFAPPFDFQERVFLPIIARMGPKVTVELLRPGFYPAGGGEFTVQIEPASKLGRIEILERGETRRRLARALVANLPDTIAKRELSIVREKLGWERDELRPQPVKNSTGPGNILMLELESEHVTEIFTGFGEKGRKAEDVARAAVDEAREYLAADVPVGEHLADQLMLPMALAGGGAFRTAKLSKHLRTNIETIQRFLDIRIDTIPGPRASWTVKMG